jgi:hypothetical protein
MQLFLKRTKLYAFLLRCEIRHLYLKQSMMVITVGVGEHHRGILHPLYRRNILLL